MRRSVVLLVLLLFGLPPLTPAQELRLPLQEGSVKFAIVGDPGQPGSGQRAIAGQMAAWHTRFPFEFVLMTGDNLYGRERAKDYRNKFEIPFKTLLDAGVDFYASLGNHDDDEQIQYTLFNMGGRKYYSFKPKNGVRFFALDTNYVDAKQLDWLDKELAASGSDWKIAFFHHPLYSSGGTHGSAELQRELIEPVFLKHGVNVALMGHEHFYERIKPQKGVAYFILGSSAKVRRGDLQKSELTLFGWDQGYAFMLVEVAGDELYFQTISDKGVTIDAGSVRRVAEIPDPDATTQPVIPQAKPSPTLPGPGQKPAPKP
jgi:hypothetical protein